jgi:hypothetical protein
LLDGSASEASLLALGLRRSPYLGLGGPVTLHTATGHVLNFGALDGPVRFRADQRTPVPATTTAVTLLVIENLQAAEAACDAYPDLAVTWTAGQPADSALRLITHLADQIKHVRVITDADLGGVRIAQRVLAALNHPETTHVIDVGEQPHTKRAPFGPDSMASLQAARRDDHVGALATACLTRGYPSNRRQPPVPQSTERSDACDGGTWRRSGAKGVFDRGGHCEWCLTERCS